MTTAEARHHRQRARHEVRALRRQAVADETERRVELARRDYRDRHYFAGKARRGDALTVRFTFSGVRVHVLDDGVPSVGLVEETLAVLTGSPDHALN
ncbi:MAG TPA: hypothetical protein PK313_13045 [Myxococcota bacterium]|nr:hypothetical protein [Myxococcota bacterium]